MTEDPILSVVVVLRPADGRALTGDEQITSDSVGRYAPDPRAVELVVSFFRLAGFDASPLLGISLSITGPRSVFERTFGDQLQYGVEGGVAAVRMASGRLELSLNHLPDDVRSAISAVSFTPPPDFGPRNF